MFHPSFFRLDARSIDQSIDRSIDQKVRRKLVVKLKLCRLLNLRSIATQENKIRDQCVVFIYLITMYILELSIMLITSSIIDIPRPGHQYYDG